MSKRTEVSTTELREGRLQPFQRFHIYASLLAISCLEHLAIHTGRAQFHQPIWWLSVGVIVAACFLLQRVTIRRFFLLIGLQILHVIVFAPFNADHWLLVCFVNVITFMGAAAIALRSKDLSIDPHRLMDAVAPAARLTFLICYGFAAFCKLNSHFLGTEASCARELAELQASTSPWVGYISVPQLAGWITVLFESSVALLLIAPRFRRLGILVGMLFHTALVISPAISVFDFTMTVFTMLFFFTPVETTTRLCEKWGDLQAVTPAIASLFARLRTPVVTSAGVFILLRSALGYSMSGNARLSTAMWFINMGIAGTLIACAAATLFSKQGPREYPTKFFAPRMAWQWMVVLVAVTNGFCPYLGLKTQGSFTMFSNLRTEDGHWNHVLVPRSVRLFSRYQDNNYELVAANDEHLSKLFIEPDYLVPKFEIQRALAEKPDLSVTLMNDGKEVTLTSTTMAPVLGTVPSWWARKLLIFRPVTRNGEPYCGN